MIIIAGHGEFAQVLIQVAESILGKKSGLQAFEFRPNEVAKDSYMRLEKLIQKSGWPVVVLVDLFDGTPGSMALSMLDEEKVAVVTGVNLGMTLKAAEGSLEGELSQISNQLAKAGREAIHNASQLIT